MGDEVEYLCSLLGEYLGYYLGPAREQVAESVLVYLVQRHPNLLALHRYQTSSLRSPDPGHLKSSADEIATPSLPPLSVVPQSGLQGFSRQYSPPHTLSDSADLELTHASLSTYSTRPTHNRLACQATHPNTKHLSSVQANQVLPPWPPATSKSPQTATDSATPSSTRSRCSSAPPALKFSPHLPTLAINSLRPPLAPVEEIVSRPGLAHGRSRRGESPNISLHVAQIRPTSNSLALSSSYPSSNKRPLNAVFDEGQRGGAPTSKRSRLVGTARVEKLIKNTHTKLPESQQAEIAAAFIQVRNRAYARMGPSMTTKQKKNINAQILFFSQKLFGRDTSQRISNFTRQLIQPYASPPESPKSLGHGAMDLSTQSSSFMGALHATTKSQSLPQFIKGTSPCVSSTRFLQEQLRPVFPNLDLGSLEVLKGLSAMGTILDIVHLYHQLTTPRILSELDKIFVQVNTSKFYQLYSHLYHDVQQRGSSSQQVLVHLGYVLAKGRCWVTLLRDCILRLVSGSTSLDTPTATQHRNAFKNQAALGHNINTLEVRFGKGIFYLLPTNCLFQLRHWQQQPLQATADAIAEEFPMIQTVADLAYTSILQPLSNGMQPAPDCYKRLCDALSIITFSQDHIGINGETMER